MQREQSRFAQCLEECQPAKITEDKDVERSTFGKFELIGTPEKYAIKRTTMMSQYVVKAQNPASQNTVIQVVALSELTFKELSENTPKVGAFKQSTIDETLLYSPEWDVKEKRFYMFGGLLDTYPINQVSLRRGIRKGFSIRKGPEEGPKNRSRRDLGACSL